MGANGKVPIGSWGKHKECWTEGGENRILSLTSSLSDR